MITRIYCLVCPSNTVMATLKPGMRVRIERVKEPHASKIVLVASTYMQRTPYEPHQVFVQVSGDPLDSPEHWVVRTSSRGHVTDQDLGPGTVRKT